ncbi:conserved hypothetical protein [Leifsonia xyli subsp. xyli str. CTCB07]|uniref:GmrSD restriction endonucleases C-terminal domain-containing protein n=1 Tax=Leifsonia xyli subsp. xyli (strain CTCB07) TaxID=281090 RepID=Q6AG01_LEIXX|nr:conserved hypothetical protein [Leifsonia xyli subsp. xyli str. CTCB07]
MTDVAETARPSPKKPWFKRWWVWAIAVFLVIGVIGSVASGGSDGKSPAASKTAWAQSTDLDEPLDPSAVVISSSRPTVAISNKSLTTGTAVDVLAGLPVKREASATGYSRTADFGAAWLDVDGNNCDTRNDILHRDLTDAVQRGGCKILSGTLNDKYSGESIHFVRGAKTSALVQVDHIVALKNAWVTGAQQLTQAQRVSFANDPLNLIAVDAHSNEQKSSGDAATWLPANKSSRCEYVARQISVKATYGLWVTPAEKSAMMDILADCSGQMAESSTFTPPAPTPTPIEAPPAPAPPAPAPPAPLPAAPCPSRSPREMVPPHCATMARTLMPPTIRGRAHTMVASRISTSNEGSLESW